MVAVSEEESAVARTHRLEHADIGRVLDEAAGIARRLVQIHDVRVCACIRIDGEVRAPDEPFVGTGVLEGMAMRERLAPGDPQLQRPVHDTPRLSATGDRDRLFMPFAATHKQQRARPPAARRRIADGARANVDACGPTARGHLPCELRYDCAAPALRTAPVLSGGTGAETDMAPHAVDKGCAGPRNPGSSLSSSSAERAGPEHPECKEPSKLAIGA